MVSSSLTKNSTLINVQHALKLWINLSVEALKQMLNLNEPCTKQQVSEPVWKVNTVYTVLIIIVKLSYVFSFYLSNKYILSNKCLCERVINARFSVCFFNNFIFVLGSDLWQVWTRYYFSTLECERAERHGDHTAFVSSLYI